MSKLLPAPSLSEIEAAAKRPPCAEGEHAPTGFECLVDHDPPPCRLCLHCARHVQFFDDGRQVLRDRS